MDSLSLLDLGFFITETEASPKHVAGLLIFTKPKACGPKYLLDLFHELLNFDKPQPPFDQVLKLALTRAPYWEHCDTIDTRQHVFYHALDKPGKRQQLYEYIAKLHSPKLKREKPLWEFHLIDRLEKRRFAIYIKIHHACSDGMSMSGWLTKNFSSDPQHNGYIPIWAKNKTRLINNSDNKAASSKSILGEWWNTQTKRLATLKGIGKLGTQLWLEEMHLTQNAVAIPFADKHSTPLTGQVSAGRQVATAKVAMHRVDAIRKQTRSSLNHVALTCIDGALHRYLDLLKVHHADPITIQMPVNLRKKGDTSGGNKIGIVLVDLARQTNDPYERLREIGFTLRNVRYQIDGVAPESVELYTILLNGLAQLAEVAKLSDIIPPLGNTLVSNVPGPKQALYLNGSKLEEMYPLSALTPSNHLNITLFSYNGNLHFGLIATRDLQHIETLSNYIYAAFAELEHSVFPGNKNPKSKKTKTSTTQTDSH